LERIRLENEERKRAILEEQERRRKEEEERIEKERIEKERQEKERQEKERLEKEKQERERQEKERLQKEEEERKELEKQEQERKEKELRDKQQEEAKLKIKAEVVPKIAPKSEHLQDTKSLSRESEITNKENENPRKVSSEISNGKNISSPIVVRRKTDHRPSSTNNEKCISDNKKENIPIQDNEEIPDDQPTSLPTRQNLPSTDPRRKTVHGSEYTTKDELMRKVSEDEQRRKASYSLVRTVGSGTDTLFHSGSGITRDFSQPLRNESLSKSTSYSSSITPGYLSKSSTLRPDEPVYYGTNSSTRVSKADPKDDIKDEANSIILAAELATKKATEDLSVLGGRTSNSRARIRELLDKQRVVDDARKEQNIDEKAQNAFKSDYGKMLWVFR